MILQRIKCAILGHNRDVEINDAQFRIKPSSALGYWTLSFCTDCLQLYFRPDIPESEGLNEEKPRVVAPRPAELCKFHYIPLDGKDCPLCHNRAKLKDFELYANEVNKRVRTEAEIRAAHKKGKGKRK